MTLVGVTAGQFLPIPMKRYLFVLFGSGIAGEAWRGACWGGPPLRGTAFAAVAGEGAGTFLACRVYWGGGGKSLYSTLPQHSFILCLFPHSSQIGQHLSLCCRFPQSLHRLVPGPVGYVCASDSLMPSLFPGFRMLVLFSHARSTLGCRSAYFLPSRVMPFPFPLSGEGFLPSL